MNRVVVLNGDYTFLNTVSPKRAICLVMKGKTEVLKYADKSFKCSDGSLFPIPLIIKLIKVVRLIYRNKVPYSKYNVIFRDDHTCVYCGSHEDLTVDHLIPSSRGGETSFENCVAACKLCNNKKKNRTPSEAKMFPVKMPYAPTISQFIRCKMKKLGIEKFLKEAGVY